MRPVRSYHESLEFLYGLSASRIELGLDRVALALALFDNPQDSLDVFHVAGTNGKGSTAAMLHQMLSSGGYRTGLYTSPHLSAFTERVRVADRSITEQEIVRLIAEIAERVEAAGIALTFFEFSTVLALLYFARQRVDTAVIEVGLGGRLDATNLVRPVVSVITSVAIDHQSFLGPDVRSIAREKAGIVKEKVPVVCGPLSPEAIEVVESVAENNDAPVYQWERDFSAVCDGAGRLNYNGRWWNFPDVEVNLLGAHQRRNAAVAIAAVELARNRFPVQEKALREGLKEVDWPGRLEVFRRSPTIILDGAHNVEGVQTLVSALPAIVGAQKVRLLFGSMSDKDWPTMLCLLCAVSSEVVLTEVPRPHTAEPAALRDALPAEVAAQVIADPVEALSRLIHDQENECVPILVAGSLYLIGLVREHLI